MKKFRISVAFAATAAVVFCLSCSHEKSAEEPADCAISRGACIKTVMSRRVTLEIRPRPVEAMKELRFLVTAEGVSEEGLVLDLDMPGMYMGENRILLRRVNGAYEGRGVIPRCPSGKKLWQATVDIPGTGKVAFRFNVAR